MTRTLLARFALLLALAPVWARADGFEFHPPASADDPGVPALIRDLAERMLPVYQDPDNERYLANLSALQMADSNYAAADDARQSLRERRQKSGKSADPLQPDGRATALDLYVHARTLAAAGGGPLDQVFSRGFAEALPKLGDREAYAAGAWLAGPVPAARDALQVAFDRSRAAGSLGEEQAVEMVWTWLALDARRNVGAVAAALAAKDGERRYAGDGEVVLRGAAGGDIHVRVLRPRAGGERRTALLQYALDPPLDDALAGAARGYAGVLAYSRVHGKTSGLPPFGHEGEDVRAVIGWIAKQSWSDGRVGLYGDGYAGFAAWAAARRPPPQLQAIATADPMAPGIDFPAPGRVFRNDAYAWALAAQSADGRSGRDDAAWQALDRKWYRSGAPYRDYDRMAGARNHAFQEWLAHPSYDRWWQKLIPYGQQFAAIGIPALTVSGYYADNQAGALYYFGEHLRHRPDAEHRLLLGPWARGGPRQILRGYTVDPAAMLDLRELRLRWFDHVFRNSALPPALGDRVNYELMGANDWRHAASADSGALRLYLDPAGGERHRLSEAVPPDSAYTSQVVNLADRRDADPPPAPDIAGRIPPPRDGLVFASEPLPQPLDLGGTLAGQLDFMLNRQDLDLSLSLYEQLADGSGLRLAAPCEFRGSYAADRTQRHMLQAGVRQQLPFRCEQWLGRRVQAGSRLVLLLEVLKRPDRQINYGGGGEVSGEALEYVLHHIKLRWYGGSYIELPRR